jgi:hypothetical protein
MLTPEVNVPGKGWAGDIFTKNKVKIHTLGTKHVVKNNKISHSRANVYTVYKS